MDGVVSCRISFETCGKLRLMVFIRWRPPCVSPDDSSVGEFTFVSMSVSRLMFLFLFHFLVSGLRPTSFLSLSQCRAEVGQMVNN